MRRIAGLIALAYLTVVGITACGGGGSGVVTGMPQPLPSPGGQLGPFVEPDYDSWNDPYYYEYDPRTGRTYYDFTEPQWDYLNEPGRSLSNSSANRYWQTLLDRDLNLSSFAWASKHAKLHIRVAPGDNLIAGGMFMLASQDVAAADTKMGPIASLRSTASAPSYLVVGLSGLDRDWRVCEVEVNGRSAYYAGRSNCSVSLGVGLPGDYHSAYLQHFSWSTAKGAYLPHIVYLNGLNTDLGSGTSYICLLIEGEMTATVESIRVKVVDLKPTDS